MFEATRLKIRRAEHHIRDLKAALEAYCRSNFCRIGIDAGGEDGKSVVRMERTRDLPNEIPLILGDAIHDLRAALDFLACDIVRSGGKQPTRYTRFVFDSSRDKLVATLEPGTLKAARPDLVELIVDTIKPYKGGDDTLCGLNDLDLDERHKLLLPVIAIVSLHNVAIRDADKRVVKIGALEVGARGEFSIPESYGHGEIAGYENASFQAQFDKGSLFEGQPVVTTLNKLVQRVMGVVDTIQKAAESTNRE
jgi:hypothetical protein